LFIFDAQEGKIQSKRKLTNYPTCVEWMKINSNHHLVVCEYNQITIFDERMEKKITSVSV
jgi:hypothetical protein